MRSSYISAPREDSVYVNHINDSIARVESYLADVDEAAFLNSPMIQDAVMHHIQIIGEAASRLSTPFRTRSSTIPWKDIVGMRQKLVHDYMRVDLEAV